MECYSFVHIIHRVYFNLYLYLVYIYIIYDLIYANICIVYKSQCIIYVIILRKRTYTNKIAYFIHLGHWVYITIINIAMCISRTSKIILFNSKNNRKPRQKNQTKQKKEVSFHSIYFTTCAMNSIRKFRGKR